MTRDEMLSRVREREPPWDMIIIGGGATGVGTAVDAASRGYDVLLLEQSDFGKGTSSRSTKLIHGGVRYLQQGNISLVMEALKERGILRLNAPHLVHDLAFIVPNYDWWETPFYGMGMKVYDLLAGQYGFGKSKILSKGETLERIPTLRTDGLHGGVVYYDGQFDDARLLINMAQTAAEQGATLLNYSRVVALTKNGEGYVNGAIFMDTETGDKYQADGQVVINATGPFTDEVRRLDNAKAEPMISPSQGVHLIFDRSFLPGDSSIMVPHTRDGRVLFAIPWLGSTLVGTTDTPIEEPCLEPRARAEEIDFILETAGEYLCKKPSRGDILSMFTGIRPLVKAGNAQDTAALSREHTLHISPTGLLTITGGKWTTYRRMAEDCVDQAATLAGLEPRPCITRTLNIHGYHKNAAKFGQLALYGADAPAISDLVRGYDHLKEQIHSALPVCAAEVVWAVRFEAARTVDDFLARRTRCLFLNARAAVETAPKVASIMARHLGRSPEWETEQVVEFRAIAKNFLP